MAANTGSSGQKLSIQIVADVAQFDAQLSQLAARIVKLGADASRAAEKTYSPASRAAATERVEAAKRLTIETQKAAKVEETRQLRLLTNAENRARAYTTEKATAEATARIEVQRLKVSEQAGKVDQQALRTQQAVVDLAKKRLTLTGGGGSPSGGLAGGLTASSLKGIEQTSLRLSILRRETKAVGMDMYRNIGNPFLVVSSLSQRITGIYQLSRDAEGAARGLEIIQNKLQAARRAGDQVRVDKLIASAEVAEKKLIGLNKQMSGAGMKMRGVADFFVNQFMTAGLFVWFQAMSTVVMGILSFGADIAGRVLNPMTTLAEQAKTVADLVDKLGGIDKISIAFNLSAEDRKAIEALVELRKTRTAAENRIALEQGITNGRGVTPGVLSEDDLKKLRLEEALQSKFAGGVEGNGLAGAQQFLMRAVGYDVSKFAMESMPGILKRGLGSIIPFLGAQIDPNLGASFLSGAASFNADKAQQQQRLDYATQIVTAMRDGESVTANELALVKEVRGVEGERLTAAYELVKAEKSRIVELGRAGDELERQRYALTGDKTGLNYGEGADMDKWFIKSVDASRMIERLQRAQTNFSAQMTARQQRQQLGQAAADVTRAGIGRPGQSGFELAAAVLEARAKAQEAREQIRIQRRQEAIQQKIEYWTKVQTNAKRQQDIMSNAMSIALNNAQMVLTVDPASGQLLARYVSADVYKMMMAAAANNTPVPAPTGTGGGGGRGRGKTPT